MRPPLRLAIVRATYSPFGGAERIVNRLAAALAARGVRITILARRWAGEAAEGLPSDVQWRRIDPFYVGGTWRMLSFARAIQRELAAVRYDLVQSHERIPGVSLYRAGDGVHREWLAQRARARGSAFPRLAELAPQHHWQLAAERAMFEHPALRCVVCNSTMVREEIVRWFGLSADRLVIVRNGVDLDRFSPTSDASRRSARGHLGLAENALVFLFVGSGFERKGVASALRALARMPVATLLVVGRDRSIDRYRRLAARLGLAERVRFEGGQRDVLPYYRAADAFLLPTLYDPQPNAVLEAMACGLPVVTSTKCGAAELLDAGCGAVVDALDADALAAAMRRFSDRSTARRAGERARAAIEPYSLQRMNDDYLELYRWLLPAAA